ncbi:Cell number regulator 8 [Nymphaea thermarum]|nr:Cell number regulator 8 [Nymphaea thermarum]
MGEEDSPLLNAWKGEKEKVGGTKEEEEVETSVGWTADGLPLGHASVVGEPVTRSQWNSSLFACLGRNDEFCSSDIEVCLLGSFVPCMLYGSNVERIDSGPGTYANHCLPYTGLYLLGNSLFGWNCLAPWFSYPSRTAIRRKFNLEACFLFVLYFCFIFDALISKHRDSTLWFWINGSCEAFTRSCGCCRGMIEDEEQREHCEAACDFATHFCCHSCSLCQEGRELRRRLPHPGFNNRSVLVMIPPVEQAMGRGF